MCKGLKGFLGKVLRTLIEKSMTIKAPIKSELVERRLITRGPFMTSESQDSSIRKMTGVVPPIKTQIEIKVLPMTMKKKVFWALLAVGTTFLATGVVSAQSTTALDKVGLLGEFKKKSLIGTWEETFTFIDGSQKGRVSVALISYHDDGTLGG